MATTRRSEPFTITRPDRYKYKENRMHLFMSDRQSGIAAEASIAAIAGTSGLSEMEVIETLLAEARVMCAPKQSDRERKCGQEMQDLLRDIW